MVSTDPEEMPLAGKAAPPMANGEVIFEAPWQSRAFGMARVLCEQGEFDWDEFRACLIHRIGQGESTETDESSTETEEYQYFDHFLAALTDIVAQKALCSEQEIQHRTREFDARPHGHDH
ncbi:MAG: nitrile hydratase accessory protein [bacterium]|nr:nitrile hydratase accessory protein [Gammaproteobacteria bacterium]HIL97255.1 nitrile hydratase accessory protein [Pseudomonadales bacterium]